MRTDNIGNATPAITQGGNIIEDTETQAYEYCGCVLTLHMQIAETQLHMQKKEPGTIGIKFV